MKVTIKSNIRAVLAQIKQAERELLPAYRAELLQIGEEIMTQAKALTPVDTGVLRASGFVELTKNREESGSGRFAAGGGRDASVTVGFGGPAQEYAEAVHDDLSASHTVGQAKFLEQPVLRAEPTIQPRIDRVLNDILRKAGLR
jgi:hypothetical protein